MTTMYDFNTDYSAKNSQENIASSLKMMNLEKYMENMKRHRIDFHTFCNMTREDMRIVGITNHRDQDALLTLNQTSAKMYLELEPKPVDWTRVKGNLLESIENLAGAFVNLRQVLVTCPAMYDELVDPETKSSEAILELLDVIESRVEFTTQDLRLALGKFEHSRKIKKFTVGALIVVTIIGLSWLLKR